MITLIIMKIITIIIISTIIMKLRFIKIIKLTIIQLTTQIITRQYNLIIVIIIIIKNSSIKYPKAFLTLNQNDLSFTKFQSEFYFSRYKEIKKCTLFSGTLDPRVPTSNRSVSSMASISKTNHRMQFS